MATGDTAISIHLTTRPQALADPSDSNISSPLSDVEDKDADGEDMDIDLNNGHADEKTHDDHEPEGGRDSASHAATDDEDDESNLSEIDVNDSEAETERLYDTPRKNTDIRDTVIISNETTNGGTPGPRERLFERSPSKLQQQIQADVDAENAREEEEDDDELSDEPEDEENHDDNSSVAPSEAESDHEEPVAAKKASPSPEKQDEIVASSTIVEDVTLDSAEETRKRKRSPTAEVSDSDQPLRKRTGSVAAPGKTSPTIDHSAPDEEPLDTPTNDHSGELSGAEDDHDLASKDKPEDVAESVENVPSETTRSKKLKRNTGKKRKGSDEEDSEAVNQDAHPAEEAAPTDEHAEEENAEAEVDEEAEAAQRNEEELERKRAAFEQLTAIEKHFAAFRDRLYEERLAQLNEEEAMLTSETPTHPEYLAMMQCIDARRDERLRVVDVEYKFNMEALERWAVARRAQILSQFYQSVRESREKALEELGRQWYEIQHERRRYAANSIPDYGIRFPTAKTQQKRQAIAHSKEVSILSGIARHEGFPAAPEMKGATASEVDEDLEAINRARQSTQQAGVQHPPLGDSYGGLAFGRSLGAAGEQFLEQTPWANPNHPSHQIQRQHSQPEHRNSSPLGPPSNRRHSYNQAGNFASSTNSTLAAASILNGESPLQKRTAPPDHELTGSAKVPRDSVPKLEAVAQAS